jgi:hypothetical protein
MLKREREIALGTGRERRGIYSDKFYYHAPQKRPACVRYRAVTTAAFLD